MGSSVEPGEYRSGRFAIVPACRRLRRDDAEIEVEGKVFDLIVLLARNHERALPRQEIIDALWGSRPITDAALSQLIYKARRALDDDGGRQSVIRTIYGRGLQWVAPIETVIPEAAPCAPVAAHEHPPRAADTTPVPPARSPRRRYWLSAAVLLVVLAAVAGFGLWYRYAASPPATAAVVPRVALLPIENATGDATLDWTRRGLPGLLGSLLGEARGISVIDPVEVAKAWGYTVPRGESRAQHVRSVVDAQVVVTGKLAKTGTLYRLVLAVDAGNGQPAQQVDVTGTTPGALAAAAAQRIRDALDLPSEHAPTLPASPSDPYLAQTFARGMDAAMHGRWSDARPYFALCASKDPGFLPCSLRLAQAQAHTNQLDAARAALGPLAEAARKRGDARIAAMALTVLAEIDLEQNRAGDALAHLDQAAPLAARAGDIALQASITLKSASAAAVLRRAPLANSRLAEARGMIQAHRLAGMSSALHNAESFVAFARGDYDGAAAADRAALTASLAAGNEFGALADTYNLALALTQAGRPFEALPLLSGAQRHAAALHNTEARFSAGNDLATILLQAGLEQRAKPLIAELLELAQQQKSRSWQAFALSLRSDWNWANGDAAAALADARAAVAHADAGQDPDTWAQLQFKAALLALATDRAQVGAMAGTFHEVVARQPAAGVDQRLVQLVRALAAAASGNATAAHAALRKARNTPDPADAGDANLERTGLAIALATGDAQAARIVLARFDPAKCSDADVLQRAARWARKQGDQAADAATEQRLAALRSQASARLDASSGT